MNARLLPPDEWARLSGTELETVWPTLDPTTAQVIVVEDDGAIVGCWSLLMCLMAEGVWIAPTHRRRGAVAAHLWREMTARVHACGKQGVLTHAATDEIRRLLERHGATIWPPAGLTAYQLPMRSTAQAKGARFHAGLPEASHPEDPGHDEAVGQAILRAYAEDPATAVEMYNAWARTHAYEPVVYAGMDGDTPVIEMNGQRIAVARDGSVRLLQEV